jgi:glycosyltransferase involved in cell wall biosynthesis
MPHDSATVSEFSRRDIATTYSVPEARIDVVYNGIGDVFRPLSEGERRTARTDFTEGAPYISCVGSLHPRKNIARLLLAFDEMLKQHPSDLRLLLIVGESFWWDDRMKEAYATMRTQGPRDLHRALGPGTLDARPRRSEALAFVSYFEGFGIPVAEAMRCGVPVVAAEATSLPEVAGDAAHYCDPFSVTDIAKCLYTMYSDEVLRTQLSTRGLKRATRYTWDNAAHDLWQSFGRMCRDAGLDLR